MSKNKTKQGDDNFQAIESSLTKTEHFIENNQKALTIGLIVILAIVGAIVGFNKFYLEPQEKDAQEQIFVAQQYFDVDSFNLALNGDGQYPGFLEIIDNYGMTKAANIANCYAGVAYNKLGDFDNAIKYLKDFDTEDPILQPLALGNIGDAYIEKGDFEKAVEAYKKAGFNYENDITSPFYLMKLGKIYESQKKYKEAVEAYKLIKEKYAETEEGKIVEKYIVRAESKL
jgi:tetratricopeptide (TPR) repeat protein